MSTKCKHGVGIGTCWLCKGNKPSPEGPGNFNTCMKIEAGLNHQYPYVRNSVYGGHSGEGDNKHFFNKDNEKEINATSD